MLTGITSLNFNPVLRPSYLYTLVVIFAIIFSVSCFGQDEIRFQAFGKTPNSVNDSLYKALNEIKDVGAKSNILYRIGNEHLTYGNADSAIFYAQKLKKLNQDLTLTKTKSLLLLGNAKFSKGLYNDAMAAFIEALQNSDELNNNTQTAWLNLGLAKIYLAKRELSKAKSNLALLKEHTNDTVAAQALFFFSDVSQLENNFEEALSYLEKASERVVEKELPKFKMQVQLRLAQISSKKLEYNKALEIYEYLLQRTLNKNYFDLYTESVLGYGEVSKKLDRFEAAEMILAMAYANSIHWNRLELQKKIVNSLRLTYQEKGDFENAYNLMTQYVSVSNQILTQQNNEEVKELEIKYQTLQKENEIFELKEEQLVKQNEIERQKTIKKAFLYGFLALLIPIVALLFVYYQKLQAQSQLNQQQEQLNSQKIRSLLSEQELVLANTSLQAQQEERSRIAKQLHDSIGGNLAGIKLQMSHFSESKPEKTSLITQINETYELVREISHNLTPKKFNENNFTFLIEQYLSQLSNNSALEINFSAHPKETINLIAKELKIEIYQIIQELITNTIKHAKAKTLEVHINAFNGNIQLIFEDDGIGFDANITKKGIGLRNLKTRIETLKGSMNIDTALQRGTVITLELPINIKRTS